MVGEEVGEVMGVEVRGLPLGGPVPVPMGGPVPVGGPVGVPVGGPVLVTGEGEGVLYISVCVCVCVFGKGETEILPTAPKGRYKHIAQVLWLYAAVSLQDDLVALHCVHSCGHKE